MSVTSKINELIQVKNKIKNAIEEKEINLENIEFREYDIQISNIPGEVGPYIIPSVYNGPFFTGATIPLTYYNMENDKGSILHYKSIHKITITGLDGRATITGNESNYVTVKFNVSSNTSSIKDFTISLNNGMDFQGIHAHYGNYIDITQTLVFYDMEATLDGSLGTLGVNYGFKVGSYDTPFSFRSDTDYKWNDLYSNQILNVKNIDYSQDYVLATCFKFNQPLDLSNVTEIGSNFLERCYSFNQELDLSSIDDYTKIGIYFLRYAYSFNQPIKLSALLQKIPNMFLSYCYAFNQPLDLSNIDAIFTDFLRCAYSFNQPLDLSNVKFIGQYVLYDANSFNQPLDLSNVEEIGDYSFVNMFNYNHPINLENIEIIGTGCFKELVSLNKPFKIGTKLTTVGNGLLNESYSLTALIWNSNKYPSNALNWDLSFLKYIKVYGTYRTNLMSALPNSSTSPFRRLIDGGS